VADGKGCAGTLTKRYERIRVLLPVISFGQEEMKSSMAERKKGVVKIAFIFYSWRVTKEVYVTGQQEVLKFLPSLSPGRRRLLPPTLPSCSV
jgi:hypothetical protein